MTKEISFKKQFLSEMFGEIQWDDDENTGHPIQCPCEGHHTTETNLTDTTIFLNDDGDTPRIHCFHQSCEEYREELNRNIWSYYRRGGKGRKPDLCTNYHNKSSVHAKTKTNKKALNKAQQDSVERRLKETLPKYPWTADDAYNESPLHLRYEKETREWQDTVLQLMLFKPDDIVWVGNRSSSGRMSKRHNFRSAKDWIKDINDRRERCPAKSSSIGDFWVLTCPSTFKGNIFHRTKENVLARRFLVIESDTLSQDESANLYKWLSSFLKLRAIVFSGNKSLHAWFDYPESHQIVDQLIQYENLLKIDPALIKNAAQPCRLAGAIRLFEDHREPQKLIWYDKPDESWYQLPRRERLALGIEHLLV
jgi:hypothetical protein